MNKRYYKKKGPSFKERLRCPLCGKLSTIGFFSQNHQFGIYRYRYGGKGDISVNLIQKSPEFMSYLKDSLKDRFLSLLEKITGCRYYSQYEVDKMMAIQHFIPSIREPNIAVPQEPTIVKSIVKPYKVVIE